MKALRMRARRTPPDTATMRQAFAGPGQDPREWLSFGTVGFDDGEPIAFDQDEGCLLVKVTLMPSFRKVYARVAIPTDATSGDGESSYACWVENDEVLVALPGGMERGGACIVGRFNNAIDRFPFQSVAGQDATTNAFSFTRMRTPWVGEYAGPWLVRNALQGSFIQLGSDGSVTLKDSENAALQLSADVIGFAGPQSQTSPPEFLLQLDLTNRHFALQVGDAVMTLSASDASPEVNTLTVPGSMTLGTLANPPLEHAASTESTVNVFFWAMTALNALIGAGPPATPLTNTSLNAIIAGWLTAGLPLALQAAAAGLPPTLLAAIQAQFLTATQKPNTPSGQLLPGIGSPGLLLG